MLRSRLSSLRFRVLILIGVAVLPAVLLNVYSAVQQRQLATQERQRSALQLTRTVADEQAHVAAGVQELLTALAMVPAIRNADPATCPALLAELLAAYPRYTSLSVSNTAGELTCRGLRPGEPANVGGMAIESAFQRALEQRTFAYGDYALGSSTRRPVVPYALPVLRPDGGVKAVLTATVDLLWLSRFALDPDLTEGAVLTVIDSTGTVLARYPDPERWIGQRLSEDAELRTMLDRGDEGVLAATGLDGVPRLYAYSHLSAVEAASTLVSVGIPRGEAFAAANRLLARNLIILSLLGLATLVAGWGVGTRLIIEPFRSLLGATRRLAAGDLDARASVRTREGELAELAFAFNEMAESLQRRTAETTDSLAALRRGEERYRSLVEATSAIVWSTPADGEFVTDQPGWRAFTGQSLAEMRGWGWLDAVHPADRAATVQAWQCAMEDRALYHFEQRLRRQDGEYRRMLVRAVPILGEAGEIREWVGVHTDITERRQAEEERASLLVREQEARAEAEDANRAKSDFLAVVSHELRTPLTSVISYAELMETDVGGTLSPRHREFVERIGASAWHLTSLVDQILEFTRIEAGRVKVHFAPVDVAALTREVVADFEPLAAAKALALRAPCPVVPVVVTSDAAKVRQILLNLLANAVKFTEVGEVAVDLVCLDGRVRLSVRDTGPGIGPEHLRHIWETFWQAENPLTRRAGGTGLGLAIVRRLSGMLGGEVQVESRLGEGSVFSFTLPVEPVAAAGRAVGAAAVAAATP